MLAGFGEQYGLDRDTAIRLARALGGVGLATEAGRRQAAAKKLFTTICPKFVRTAVQILDELP